MLTRRLTFALISGIGLFLCLFSCSKPTVDVTQEKEFERWDKMIYDSVFYNINVSKQAILNAYTSTDNPQKICEVKLKEANIFHFEIKLDSIPPLLQYVESYCNSQPLTEDIHWLLGGCYDLQAKVYMLRNQQDSVLLYFQKAHEHVKLGRPRPEHLAITTLNLADTYILTNDYVASVDLYRNLLRQADSLQLSTDYYFEIYSGLGKSYLQLRNFELSNLYYDMAGELLDQVPEMFHYTYFNNRGNVYYYMKEYDPCIMYFEKARNVAFNHPELTQEKNLCALNLAHVYLFKEKPDSTRKYLDYCEPYFREVENLSAIYYIETLQIGLAIYDKNWRQIEQLVRQAYIPAGPIDVNMLTVRHNFLKEYYERTGRYKEAYQILTQEKQLEDSLRNESVKKNVAEIELRYQRDTTVMNRNLAIQRKESEAQSLKSGLLITGLIAFLLVAGLIALIFYSRKQKEYTEMKNRLRFVDLKMENIRNRISPHFIFNNLNRILHSPAQAEQRLTHLSDLIHLLRTNLQLVDRTLISLEEELDFVEKYIQIEKQALQGNFVYNPEIAPDIHPEQIRIPAMMIQIPVENAVKHGLRGKEGDKELSICIERKDSDMIRITITDNGSGFNPVAVTSQDHTGTGLKVIRQTIHLYNLFNNDKLMMNIHNREENGEIKGCRIEIQIPEHIISPEHQDH